jgi:hypothetical protein
VLLIIFVELARAYSRNGGYGMAASEPKPQAKTLSNHFVSSLNLADLNQWLAASLIMSAAFSPIIIEGALVLPSIRVGMIDASTTLKPSTPTTRNWYRQPRRIDSGAASDLDRHPDHGTV